MRYRKVDPKIWNDAKFNSLSDNGKLVFFFLLTHPHMTPVGAMRATIPGLAEELNWKTKAFREAFKEPFSKGMVKHNEKAHFISLPNFMKYNPPENPNVVTAWAKCMDDIPECDEKNQLYYDLKDLLKGYAKGFMESFLKAFDNPTLKTSPKQEQEQEQEQEQYKTYSQNSDEYRLAEFLFDHIQKRDAKAKEPDFQKWAVHTDRLIRLDGRTAREVAEVIRWCQNDIFWQTNILSTAKLREKFPILFQKMKSNGNKLIGDWRQRQNLQAAKDFMEDGGDEPTG